MKKLMLLAALLALVLATAVPAIAQVAQDNNQALRSGDASQTNTETGGGDNSNACLAQQGSNNSGNAANNTGVLQYFSDGEVGVDAGGWEMNPDQSNDCDQKVNQNASASGK